MEIWYQTKITAEGEHSATDFAAETGQTSERSNTVRICIHQANFIWVKSNLLSLLTILQTLSELFDLT